MPVSQEKLDQLKEKFVADLGATLHAGMAVIGDTLGLYKAIREAGPLTSGELAERTGTHERYIREWLNSQASGGYLEYDAASGRYWPQQSVAMEERSLPPTPSAARMFEGAQYWKQKPAHLGGEPWCQGWRGETPAMR